MNEPKRGEIWWVKNPNKPFDPHQPRTAIVLSTNGRNRRASHILVVPTYSKAKPHHTHVDIHKGQGGILENSKAACAELFTLDKSLLHDGPLGQPLSDEIMQQIVKAVRVSIGDLVVEGV